MDESEIADGEIDPRFPGGPWTGFFLQYWAIGRHTTTMDITWKNSQLLGAGKDVVGRFTLAGRYDLGSGKCEWTKRYVGRHAIEYRGVNDGHGIWGVWELPQLFGLFTDRGGFHIWPEGTDVSEESDRTEQAVLEMMRWEFGRPVRRIIRWGIFAATVTAIVLLGWRWRW